MKKFELFDKVQATQARQQLPTGGYRCKILKAEETEYTWGSVFVVSFDIAVGEYAGFYKKDFNSQDKDKEKKWRGTYRLNLPNGKSEKADEFNARQFKSFTQAVEKSNPGYKWSWDEETLKEKMIGLVFGEEEWSMNGKTGMTVKARYATSIDEVEKAKVPQPKMINGGSSQVAGAQAEDDDDLPF